MAGDYEFSKKPWRMTNPPQNQSKWLPGFEGIEVRLYTDPTDIAILARECTWGDPFTIDLDDPELRADVISELQGGKVLGAAFEVPSFGFLIRASRSTMDQMLRLREAAGAAQTTRDNDFRNFNIVVPDTVERLKEDHPDLYERVRNHIEESRELYGTMVDTGIVPPQDARYMMLPLGAQTHWLQIQDLRATTKMCEQRLCNGLTQHETDYVVRIMRDEVVKLLPWTEKMLRSACEKRGQCVSRSMLFPACGAFAENEKTRLEIQKFNPDQHLYSNVENAGGMILARWDIERQKLEAENPEKIYSMAGPPEELL